MNGPTAPPLSGGPSRGVDPVTQTFALLQPWIAYVPKRQRRLGLLIFLVLLAHVAALFFIRIDTTRSDLQRPAFHHLRVENLSTPATDNGETDRFWDRLTDPRLFILPPRPSATLMAQVPPDFSDLPSGTPPPDDLIPAPAGEHSFLSETVAPLEESVAGTMQPIRQPFIYDENPRAIAASTTWQWDASLTQRSPSGTPVLPSPISDTELNPTKLRVAVDADGSVAHVLLEESCGKLELDQQAILAMRKVRFHADEQAPLLWGRTTVLWHYSATPREIVVPTPPSAP